MSEENLNEVQNNEEFTENAFEERLREIAENPDLNEIARLVVNMLSEQTSQIQSKVYQDVLISTMLNMLLEKELINLEEFQKQFTDNLEETDQELARTLKEEVARQESALKE